MQSELVCEVVVSAPPQWVFRALTDAEQLGRWWDGDGTRWTIDARLGGVWTSSGRDESCGPWSMDGVILEWDPARLLGYSWNERVQYRPSLGPALVRYELDPVEGGTRLRVTHTGFDGYPEALASYTTGWPFLLEKLRAYARHSV
jgi:uncharacterized protein YndB with AHSA1/START domain